MELTFLNRCNDIQRFLEETLKDKLQEEIDAFIRRNVRSHKKADEIITNNAVAMLGLVKSALIRNENPIDVWAMQQYQIHNSDNQLKGMADMYVFFRKPEFDCEFIIEASCGGMFSSFARNEPIEREQNIRDAMKTGVKYYKCEQDYFSSTTYVVTMFFEPFHQNDMKAYEQLQLKRKPLSFQLKEYLLYYLPPYSFDFAEYQFYILPKDSQLALSVYGQIKLVKLS